MCVCVCVCVCECLSICLSVYLSIHLSIYLSIYLSMKVDQLHVFRRETLWGAALYVYVYACICICICIYIYSPWCSWPRWRTESRFHPLIPRSRAKRPKGQGKAAIYEYICVCVCVCIYLSIYLSISVPRFREKRPAEKGKRQYMVMCVRVCVYLSINPSSRFHPLTPRSQERRPVGEGSICMYMYIYIYTYIYIYVYVYVYVHSPWCSWTRWRIASRYHPLTQRFRVKISG